MSRVGYFTDEQFAEFISPSVGNELSGTFQPLDGTLTALAGLDGTTGLVEQTGADVFVKRALGTGAATSVLTRGDGDGRYALTAHTHAISDITNLQTALDAKLNLAGGTLTGPLSGTDITLSGNLIAANVDISPGGRLVTPLLRLEGTAPELVIKDTDSPSASMRALVSFYDNTNAEVASVGRPWFDGNLWIQNAGGNIYLARAIGGSVMVTVNSVGVNVAGTYSVSGTQVIGARRTGWSTATGTATRTSFDTATVTTAQLAERVKALIDDLHATAGHGVIGT